MQLASGHIIFLERKNSLQSCALIELVIDTCFALETSYTLPNKKVVSVCISNLSSL